MTRYLKIFNWLNDLYIYIDLSIVSIIFNKWSYESLSNFKGSFPSKFSLCFDFEVFNNSRTYLKFLSSKSLESYTLQHFKALIFLYSKLEHQSSVFSSSNPLHFVNNFSLRTIDFVVTNIRCQLSYTLFDHNILIFFFLSLLSFFSSPFFSFFLRRLF